VISFGTRRKMKALGRPLLAAALLGKYAPGVSSEALTDILPHFQAPAPLLVTPYSFAHLGLEAYAIASPSRLRQRMLGLETSISKSKPRRRSNGRRWAPGPVWWAPIFS
jgi:hypothetical protein